MFHVLCIRNSLDYCCGIVLCRYRKWDLGSGIELICRCEHDASTYGPNGELQLMNIKALNEWDSRVCRLVFLCAIVVRWLGGIIVGLICQTYSQGVVGLTSDPVTIKWLLLGWVTVCVQVNHLDI